MSHDRFAIRSITQHTAISRRAAVSGVAAAGATLALGLHAGAQTPEASPVTSPGASPAASPISAGAGRYLFAADRTQTAIEVYSVPDGALAGRIEDITCATHAGSLLLPDGRLLFGDQKNEEIVTLAVGADGTPAIVDRVPATFGSGAAWIAASPTLDYVTIGSLREGEHSQVLNIVEIATFTNTAVEFAMNEDEELTAWLLNDPLNLYVAVGGQIKSYVLADILASGSSDAPLSTVEVELGSHGGATDVLNDRIFYTTAPGTGFEVLDASKGAVEYLTQVPWDVDGLTGGRNARPRVTGDGAFIFGLMTPGLDDPAQWAATEVSIHVTDMAALTAVRRPVANGNFGYRWGMNGAVALWAGYADAEMGTAYLIDANSTSGTFGTVVAEIAIPKPTNAAVAGKDFEGTDTYTTAVLAANDFGFISVNGDQVVQVIDLATHAIVGTFPIGMPMKNYDGYLAVVETGIVPADVWGR
ncbi:MAG: hypothetical protein QM753_18885 [Thermomicrobiales bacterium]